MALMGVREYARHRSAKGQKISHTAVLKAIEAGRIQRRKDGRIDSARADRDWADNTDTMRPRNSITGRPRARRSPVAPESPMGAPDEASPAPTTNGHHDGALHSYARSRAITEAYKARQAKLDYEESEGRLVDIEEVRRAAFRAGQEARRRLGDLANTLGGELSVVVNPLTITQVLQAAFDRVLDDLARNFQTGTAAPPGAEERDPDER